MNIDEAAASIGVDLLPWQRDVGQRILDGERVVMAGGKRAGRATLKRVLDRATNREVGSTDHEPTTTNGAS